MKLENLITRSKLTGKEYFVTDSLRGRYFWLVERSHPAQRSFLALRRDFEKPWVETIEG